MGRETPELLRMQGLKRFLNIIRNCEIVMTALRGQGGVKECFIRWKKRLKKC